MVQIGNFHLGKTETAKQPTIDIHGAAILWDFLIRRYQCLEETNIYLSLAKDKDFVALLKSGIEIVLLKQIEKTENEMEKYRLPLPKRSPKSRKDLLEQEIEINDQYMFNRIFTGCQSYIDYLAQSSRSLIFNDSLRKMFTEFLKTDLFFFDKLCLYGKTKGWLQEPPIYKH